SGDEVASAPKIAPKGAAPTMNGSVAFSPSSISVRRSRAAASIPAACAVDPSDNREIHPRFFARQARNDIEPARDRVDRAGRTDADAHAVPAVARQREGAGRAYRDTADARLQREGIRRPFFRQIEPAMHRAGVREIGQAREDLARGGLAPGVFVAPLGGDAV